MKRLSPGIKAALGGIILTALMFFIVQALTHSWKDPFAESLSKATGLKIEMASLSLDVLHGLRLSCNGLRIRGPDDNFPILNAEKMLAEVEFAPLLKGQFKIIRG